MKKLNIALGESSVVYDLEDNVKLSEVLSGIEEVVEEQNNKAKLVSQKDLDYLLENVFGK